MYFQVISNTFYRGFHVRFSCASPTPEGGGIYGHFPHRVAPKKIYEHFWLIDDHF